MPLATAFLLSVPLKWTPSCSPARSSLPHQLHTCRRSVPRCSERTDSASHSAVSTPSSSASGQPVPLPSFKLLASPHLSDYISDVPQYTSPLLRKRSRKTFTAPGEVVLSDICFDGDDKALSSRQFTAFQKAGPREQVVYGPGVRAAIVSCGGICPGINTVIRELTSCLVQYEASKIFGVPHGYRGFYSLPWRQLTLDDVEEVHKVGGSILGSSRGGFDLVQIVDAIETRRIDQVFVIGGDGTIMGCDLIFKEVQRRGLKTAVVSVPKTIDNDIAVIDRSFGRFDSFFFVRQRSFVWQCVLRLTVFFLFLSFSFVRH